MLQKIEVCFKEHVQRNRLCPNILGHNGGQEAESPSSAFCSANSDMLEPSFSFRIEIGRNETERKNLLRRYEDLQTWIWKECFNSLPVHSMAYGKNRCYMLLGICDICLSTYDSKDICPCLRTHSKVVARGNFSEQCNGENNLMDGTELVLSNTSPLRIRLIKAILSSIEAAIPFEALHSSWTEDLRKTWGLELHKLSSIEDLLQLLTQLEGAVKRDYLSEDFETTEELLCCDSSRDAASESINPGPVPQLPWIPKTAAAVALRLLELDVSIFYTPKQKAESLDEKKKVEALPKFAPRYGHMKDTQKAETTGFDRLGYMEDNLDNLRDTPGSSGYKQVVRGRGGGRPRRKLQKGATASVPRSGKQSSSTKQGETLAQILLQQGIRTPGQKHGRGRRTIRRRRTEKKTVDETLQDYLNEKASFRNAVEEEPRNAGREEATDFRDRNNNLVVENNESSSGSMEDSDDNEDLSGYEKWGMSSSYGVVSNMSEEEDDDEMDDDNGYDDEEDDGENMEGGLGFVDDDDELDGDDVERNRDEGSESDEYSD